MYNFWDGQNNNYIDIAVYILGKPLHFWPYTTPKNHVEIILHFQKQQYSNEKNGKRMIETKVSSENGEVLQRTSKINGITARIDHTLQPMFIM